MARKISRSSGRKPAPPRRSREEELVENFLLGVLLFFLAVVVFYPAFHAGFVWDDDQLLTANPEVQSPTGWWTLWLKPATADYFPLMSTTLWIEFHLGQLFDFQNHTGGFFSMWNLRYLPSYGSEDILNGYHIMNVIYHAIAVVLTWQMLKRLRIPGAWIAAAIFAVHPVCVESVAWISERKNSISQIFFLLSIIHYVRFEEKGRLWRYVAAVVCFTLSLLAKTSVVMLPFVLLLLAWWRYRVLEPMRGNYTLERNRSERGILVWSCAAAGALAGGALVYWLVLRMAPAAVGALPDGGDGRLHWILWNVVPAAVGAVLGGGSGHVAGLQLVRVKKWESFAGFELIRTIPFFIVAFVLGAVTFYFQNWRAIGGEEIPIGNPLQRVASACFATGFYLYSALWPFNIIEIYPQWHRAFTEIVTEPTLHTDYGAPESISYWVQTIPGLIIGGLLVWCWMRRHETWARALLVGLGCYILAMLPALGLLKMSYMRLTLVADHFQYISIVAVIALVVAAGQTRSLKPPWLIVAALFFLGVTIVNWNQTQDNHIEELIWIAGAIGLAIAPPREETWKWVWGSFVVALIVSCSVISYNQAGIYQNEESLWSATLAKNPNTWQGHNHLGAALYMRGDVKDAWPHFAAAVRLKPENPESHNNLGLALSYFHFMTQAIKEFQTAVKIKDDAAMETNLGNAYEQVQQFELAVATYKHALDLNPNNASTWCNLGYALMVEGDMDEAIPCFMQSIMLDPRMPQGRQDLDQALRKKGIDPAAPVLSGTYKFDVEKALDLRRKFPPLPQQQQPPQ